MSTASINAVWKACCEITGDDKPVDKHAHLIDDMGIDSLGLAELVIQLEETYGEGVITVDDLLANPIVADIASKLGGGGGAVAAAAAGVPEKKPIRAANTTTPVTGVAPVAGATTPPPSAIFLFAGEGAHAANADLSVLKTSPSFAAVDAALMEQHGESAVDFLGAHMGDHAPPHSPVVTTVLNILMADLWILWGRTHAHSHTHILLPRIPESLPLLHTHSLATAAL